MKMMQKVAATLLGLGAVTAMIAGCSENNDTTVSNPSAPVSFVNGTVATGRAIVGGTISIKDSRGTVVTSTSDGNGFYQYTGPSGQLQPPFVLEVSGGTVNGLPNSRTFHSLSATGGRVNLTPLTELLFAGLLRTGNTQTTFGTITPVQFGTITQANIEAIQTAIRNILTSRQINGTTSPFIANSVDTTAFADFISLIFSPNGAGADAVLDLLQLAITNFNSLIAEIGAANLSFGNGGGNGTGGTTGGTVTGGTGNGTSNRLISGGTYSYTITPDAGFNGATVPVGNDGIVGGVYSSNSTSSTLAIQTAAVTLSQLVQTRSLVIGIVDSTGPLQAGHTYPVVATEGQPGSFFSNALAEAPIGAVGVVKFNWVTAAAATGNATVTSLNNVGINVTYEYGNLVPNPAVANNQSTGNMSISGQFSGTFGP
jgi:hypothetical protein